jgi:hypothetical protein
MKRRELAWCGTSRFRSAPFANPSSSLFQFRKSNILLDSSQPAHHAAYEYQVRYRSNDAARQFETVSIFLCCLRRAIWPTVSCKDAMDPDFFEVVMGADGTLKFVPVTEQAHAEVALLGRRKQRHGRALRPHQGE